MRKLFVAVAVLGVLASLLVAQSNSNCVSSNATTWTGTAFATQKTQFNLGPFTLAALTTPAVGSGGPVFAVSQNDLNGLTGNQYPNAAALIRQSDNGFWEVYNGATNAYTHQTAVMWVATNPPTTASTITVLINFNITAKTYIVTVTTPSGACATGCLLTSASGYSFRSTAPSTSLGYWNLDGTAMTLMACGVALQMPNPIINTISPNAGPLGTSVTVTGQNFGASQGNSNITFGGVPATTVSAWSATSITATVPNTATTGNVLVNVNNLNSNGVTFTVTTGANPTPPVVVSVSQTATLGLACGPNAPPPVQQHTVGLSWSASTSTGITAYNVYRSVTSGSGYSKLASTAATVLSFSDQTVSSGATYYYVVTAVAGANESVYSNQASASIP